MCDGEDDEPRFYTLTYDRFAAAALTQTLARLMRDGLVGTRGKGGSYDYCLALPE